MPEPCILDEMAELQGWTPLGCDQQSYFIPLAPRLQLWVPLMGSEPNYASEIQK